MKKILLLVVIIFLLSGCINTQTATIKFNDINFQMKPSVIDNCSNDLKEYYIYGDKKVYLICFDEINLINISSDKKTEVLNIKTLRDYYKFLDQINTDNTITIYMDNNVSEDEINYIKSKIDKYENILYPSTIKTKEDWKNEILNSSNNFSNFLDNINENSLSDTIIAKVKDVNTISKTAFYIESLEGVEYVQYIKSGISLSNNVLDEFINNFSNTKAIKRNDGVTYMFNNLSIKICNTNINKNIYIGNYKYIKDNNCN